MESGLVNETMRDYLTNLSNFVIDSVNKNVISEDETETSIQETVTVEFKNKNGWRAFYIFYVFCIQPQNFVARVFKFIFLTFLFSNRLFEIYSTSILL